MCDDLSAQMCSNIAIIFTLKYVLSLMFCSEGLLSEVRRDEDRP